MLKSPMLTVEQAAARLGVDRDGVSRLIATGELRAVNVARDRSAKRPSWRIRPEDLEAFELSRLSTPTPKATRRSDRAKRKTAKREWF